MLGGIAGAAIVGGLTCWLPFGAALTFALVVPAFVVSAALVSWCASARSEGWVVGRTLGSGAFLAAVLGGVYLPPVIWLLEPHNADFGRLALYWALGLVASLCCLAPVGAVISLAFLPILFPAHYVRKEPSLGAADHMLVCGGLWLGTLGFVGSGLAGLAIVAMSEPPLAFVSLGIGLLTMFAGVVSLGLGVVSSGRRKQWLADVRAGAAPGYRIVRIDTSSTELLPLLHGDIHPDGALVRVVSDEEVAYREAAVVADDEPLALVSL